MRRTVYFSIVVCLSMSFCLYMFVFVIEFTMAVVRLERFGVVCVVQFFGVY